MQDNQQNPMLMLRDALLLYISTLTHMFQAIHKELGGDTHEGNGDYDYTEANPRVDFWLCLRKFTLLFPKGIWGSWMEFEGIFFARRVGQEDTRADIAKTR